MNTKSILLFIICALFFFSFCEARGLRSDKGTSRRFRRLEETETGTTNEDTDNTEEEEEQTRNYDSPIPNCYNVVICGQVMVPGVGMQTVCRTELRCT